MDAAGSSHIILWLVGSLKAWLRTTCSIQWSSPTSVRCRSLLVYFLACCSDAFDCWSFTPLRQALARERVRRACDGAPPEVAEEVEREWTQMLADAVRPLGALRPACTPAAPFLAPIMKGAQVRALILWDS